jgi:hypothetical protein
VCTFDVDASALYICLGFSVPLHIGKMPESLAVHHTLMYAHADKHAQHSHWQEVIVSGAIFLNTARLPFAWVSHKTSAS